MLRRLVPVSHVGLHSPFRSFRFCYSALADDDGFGTSRFDLMLSWTKPPFGSKSTVPRGNGELILVVDDQRDIRDLLDTVLTGHGYRTVLAVDGKDALTVFQQQADHVAMVITDLNMPHIEGGSLADLLRQFRAGLPILFMSGLTTNATRHEAMLAVTKHPFLPKPFRPIALLDAIHKLLQRRGVAKA